MQVAWSQAENISVRALPTLLGFYLFCLRLVFLFRTCHTALYCLFPISKELVAWAQLNAQLIFFHGC